MRSDVTFRAGVIPFAARPFTRVAANEIGTQTQLVLEHLLPLPRYIERENCLGSIFMILSVWQQMLFPHAKSFVSADLCKAFATKTFYTSGSKCFRFSAQNGICYQTVAADAPSLRSALVSTSHR
jgi:hypothetical protein